MSNHVAYVATNSCLLMAGNFWMKHVRPSPDWITELDDDSLKNTRVVGAERGRGKRSEGGLSILDYW